MSSRRPTVVMQDSQDLQDTHYRQDARGMLRVLAEPVRVAALAAALCACSGPGGPPAEEPRAAQESPVMDPHTFARPEEAVVRHLDLDLSVDFAARRLRGRASWDIEMRPGTRRLILDSRGLHVEAVTLDDGVPATFQLGEARPFLGQPLAVDLLPGTRQVHVQYETEPDAAALQWLEPAMTSGKRHPFLFTQSQAILARTWVPCQDSPGIRFTYAARVQVPPRLMAVMSASNATGRNASGIYQFTMPQPVPAYLLALAVGDLEFCSLGPRTGVYAEPAVVGAAAGEFTDTEAMLKAAERLYGPYRWERYDIIVLPPSFPFGGMENPRLTFATPTILAGDRSLVSLIAHELAHSWSGNLVTAATWNDFWLNEGFTVYFERRIMEEVYGREYEQMLAVLGLQDLRRSMDDLHDKPADTHLFLDLKDRDPDDGMTDVAYEKGALFLRTVEVTVGRARFDAFLRRYFDEYAFRSMTTDRFLAYLDQHLLAANPAWSQAIDVPAWVYGPGLPPTAPQLHSAELARVEAELASFLAGGAASVLKTEGWTTQHWLHFLRGVPADAGAPRLAELDAAFAFTRTGNSEILHEWLLHATASQYREADAALESFLLRQGRRKFLLPQYKKLAETPGDLARAREIYARARPTYHSVSVNSIDEVLGWPW